MPITIREYEDCDAGALHQCVVELQDFERALEPRLRPGEIMADAYCANLHERCRHAEGRIFVAESDGGVIGFVAVLAREPFTELDDPPGTYALVTDLSVLATHRRQRVARRLLARAEAYARADGATELRIGVLARNDAARRLYLSEKFSPYAEVFSKPLT